MTAELRLGDCREVLTTLRDLSVDAVVTDPPAGIGFMNRDWDSDKGGRDQWITWLSSIMRECLRVLKPGGHALVWALPRTSHWTGMAIEDAGFEVRDRISYLFGSGFPKALNVSKAIDKAAGAEREVVGVNESALRPNRARLGMLDQGGGGTFGADNGATITAPATDAVKLWDGWGTALKPACEDWWLARKPLEVTVAANVLKYGTGALNIDACRIGYASAKDLQTTTTKNPGRNGELVTSEVYGAARPQQKVNSDGRWPANIIFDEESAVLLDNQSGRLSTRGNKGGTKASGLGYRGGVDGSDRLDPGSYGDSGGASRFFYVAKASRSERERGCGSNKHPTVKPVQLARYLCRLITPPGGLVLDPFCGSGSIGVAAVLEGFSFLGIELESEYAEIAMKRIGHAVKNPEAYVKKGAA